MSFGFSIIEKHNCNSLNFIKQTKQIEVLF